MQWMAYSSGILTAVSYVMILRDLRERKILKETFMPSSGYETVETMDSKKFQFSKEVLSWKETKTGIVLPAEGGDVPCPQEDISHCSHNLSDHLTGAWCLDNDDGLGHTLFGTAQLCTYLALYLNLRFVLQL